MNIYVEMLICGIIGAAAMISDIRIKKIPVIVIALGITAAFLYKIVCGDIFGAMTGGIPGCIFLVMAFLSREAIGYGDAGIIAAAGICISLVYIMQVIMVSFMLCSIYGIALGLLKGRKRGRRIIYTPFFLLGLMCVFGGRFFE